MTGCIGGELSCFASVDSPLISVSACAKSGMEKKRLAANNDIGAQWDVLCDILKFIYKQPLRYVADEVLNCTMTFVSMAQLSGKVNHFGATGVSNLYKNQQITIYLDFVSLFLDKIKNDTLLIRGPSSRFQSFKTVGID